MFALTETHPVPSSPTSNFPPSSSDQWHILLVDDSPTARGLVRQSLTDTGLQVSEAGEGREGLHKAMQQRFDLVITDMHMPTMDGLVFLRELRQLPNYDRVPVLVLTSDCSKERLEAGREAGATAWLIKPPNLNLLPQTIRHAILNGR